MYWWNIKRLKDALAERPLTAREQLSYYIATWMLVYMLMALSQLAPAASAPEVLVHFILSIAIVVFGSLYCYVSNGGADGKEFLPRLFAVGWVVSIRWSVVAIPLIIFGSFFLAVLSILVGDTGPDPADAELGPIFTVASSALVYLLSIVLIWRCGVHLRDVARRTTETPATG